MSVPQIVDDNMVEVEAEYFIYLASENMNARFDAPDGAEWTFGKASNRVAKWSARHERTLERRARSQLDAVLAACGESGLELGDEAFEKFEVARGDLFRHYGRAKVMIRQLVDLAMLPNTILGEFRCAAFECDCVSPDYWLRPSVTSFKCLPLESWPVNSGVPPFILFNGNRFSPVPIEGWKLYGGCKPDNPRVFKFRVPQSFLELGGWHSISFPAS